MERVHRALCARRCLSAVLREHLQDRREPGVEVLRERQHRRRRWRWRRRLSVGIDICIGSWSRRDQSLEGQNQLRQRL